MYKVRNIKEFIAESVIDEISKKEIFTDEWMSLSKFLKICKRSPEAKKARSGNYNFGKGIMMAETLKKELPQHKFKVRAYRSEWNYGGNIVINIILGEDYNSRAFSYSSGDSTRQPAYSFSKLFNGTVKPSDPGKVEKQWGMGVIHGSYQSISQYDKFMSDVVGVFKDFERVNGEPFDMKIAIKKKKENDQILKEWNKIEPKILKQYEIAKSNSRKVHAYIELRQPRIDVNKKAVFYKTDEPRELRHPEEYGERAEKLMSTKEYRSYEKAQANISDIIEPFVKKHGFEFVWAADWTK